MVELPGQQEKKGTPVLKSRLPQILFEREHKTGDKLTGRDLAEAADVNEGTISKLMSPKPIVRPDYPSAKAISGVLGIPWHALFYETFIAADEDMTPEADLPGQS